MQKSNIICGQVNKHYALKTIMPNRTSVAYHTIYNKLMARINDAVQEAEKELKQLKR